MSTQRAVAVRLTMPGEAETQALANVEDWDALNRARRAVIALALCWSVGGVVLFTFIPIVHLVVSATLLVGGPIIATLRFLQRATLRKIEGPCPRCKVTPGKFSFGGNFKTPKNLSCETCGNLVEMTLAG